VAKTCQSWRIIDEQSFSECQPQQFDGTLKDFSTCCEWSTGYVPRWPFKFGKTYREECDICLAEFLGGRDYQQLKQRETQAITRSLPSLRPVSGDPQVRDQLDNFHQRGFVSSDARQSLLAVIITYHIVFVGFFVFLPRVTAANLAVDARVEPFRMQMQL